MSSNSFGQIGSMFNMAANDFDPFGKIEFPGSDQFWVNKAQKASDLTWKNPSKTGEYQGQYADNGYSSQQAKSMYQQPSDGDWSKYQQNLQQPGEAAAKTAYDQAMASIKGSAAATGMYGSSVMNNQATDKAGRNYTDALTSNASQAAVNTQQAQESSNQYMADLEKSLLGSRMSEWNSLGGREQESTQAENEWNWNTMQYDNALEKSWWDDYIMKQASWDQTERDKLFNNYLTWWGMGNPLEDEATMNDTASKAAGREEDSGWGDVLTGGLGLLGKIGGYGTGGGSTIGGSLFSSLFK